jgi:predicted permease
MAWFNRLVNLMRSKRLTTEIDRELEFHIEERVDELVASGMRPADARREALRRFGGQLQQRERTRDMDVLVWLDTVFADVRHALRSLRANPVFSLVAILSLALGIGANTAIFSLINAVLLAPLPVDRPEELVRITRDGARFASLTNPIWEELRDRQDVFSGVFAFGETRFNLAEQGEARRVAGNWVSGDYFTTLGVRPVLGRLLSPEDDVRGCPPVAVLSHSLWRSGFGADPGVIGRTLPLDGHRYTVVGVAAPSFTGAIVGAAVQVYVPLCTREIHEPGALDRRSQWFLHLMGRPDSGVTLTHVGERLETLSPAIHAAAVPTEWGVEQQRAFLEARLVAEPSPNGLSYMGWEYSQPLYSLMVMVGVVLLIACVNVANLLLARGAARQREVAIRLAIGAGRIRLWRQLFTESLMLALLAAGVGIAFAQWSSRLLVAMLSTTWSHVYLDLSLNGRILGFTILVASLTGVLFGLAPAIRSTRSAPHNALRVAGRGIAQGRSRVSAGKVLVTTQVALSLVLLVAAGLLLGTFRRLATLDPGFEPEGVLLVNVTTPPGGPDTETPSSLHRDLLERFRSMPDTRSASVSTQTPIGRSTWNNFVDVEGFTPSSREDALVYFNEVSDGYFGTLHTALLAGRDFHAGDVPGSERVALINASMAGKFFGEAYPIGREFLIRTAGDGHEPPVRVIGVVEDAKYEDLRETALPIAYFSMNQNPEPWATVYELSTAGAPESLIQGVKQVVEEVNPNLSLEFRTLAGQVDASLTRERMLALLSAFFGGLALLLSMMGLYGTLSYSVARRRKEIGVRVALGAQPARVLRMVLREAGAMVIGGLVIGVIAALAGARLISSFLFGLTPTDPATVVLAAGLLATVAFVASAIPAWRAARTDAMVPLREE